MPGKAPKLSVMVETYNHEGFIFAALDSVLHQSWFEDNKDFEIIVVDDQSTDKTPDIVREFEGHVRLIEKKNGGQASAMNTGLEACRGDIIMMLDGDDWWHNDKVARVMAEFEAHPEIVAVGHGITIVDEMNGTRTDHHPSERTIIDLRSDAGVEPVLANIGCLGTSRYALRREMLAKVGRCPETVTYESDEYYFTLLPALGPVHVLPDCLTYYRLHGANLYQASTALAGVSLDFPKLRKRGEIFRCLQTTISRELVEHGIPAARAAAITQPLDIAATRLELQTAGGSRARTFAIERRSQRWLASRGQGASLKTRLGVLIAALLMPPASFYAMRTRYAGSRARKAADGAPDTVQKGNA
jgi:glycosyltransferase involved in cell wall biosynthesis